MRRSNPAAADLCSARARPNTQSSLWWFVWHEWTSTLFQERRGRTCHLTSLLHRESGVSGGRRTSMFTWSLYQTQTKHLLRWLLRPSTTSLSVSTHIPVPLKSAQRNTHGYQRPSRKGCVCVGVFERSLCQYVLPELVHGVKVFLEMNINAFCIVFTTSIPSIFCVILYYYYSMLLWGVIVYSVSILDLRPHSHSVLKCLCNTNLCESCLNGFGVVSLCYCTGWNWAFRAGCSPSDHWMALHTQERAVSGFHPWEKQHW